MTEEEVRKVEAIVNEQITRDLPVSMEVMTLEQARAAGAIALFGEKYGEKVKVYTIGDFSKEVCGGPHVERHRRAGEVRHPERAVIVRRRAADQGGAGVARPRPCARGPAGPQRAFGARTAAVQPLRSSGRYGFCSFSSSSPMPRFLIPMRWARVSTSSALSLLSRASQLWAISMYSRGFFASFTRSPERLSMASR